MSPQRECPPVTCDNAIKCCTRSLGSSRPHSDSASASASPAPPELGSSSEGASSFPVPLGTGSQVSHGPRRLN